MITVGSIIPYISETNSTSSSLEKKNPSREKEERKKRWKRGEEEKRDGKSLCERKGKRENEMWKKRRKERRENEREGKGEERRGRERRRENREGGTRNIPPSPDAFPSTKLGNNITPIKGRLGKNTTPTSKGPTKLNRILKRIPGEDNQASTLHFTQVSVTHQEGQNIQDMGSIATEPPFIRRLKHSETRAIVSNSP